ncbi:MAG: hypothetical protein ABIH83_02420 [Candidatus Micrarchaeota archaeon]
MKKGKTPLLMAFGSHGHKFIPPDRTFFRSTIAPFLEKNFKEGRKITILSEGIFRPPPDKTSWTMPFLLDQEDITRLDTHLVKAQATMRYFLDKTVHKGITPNAGERTELSSLDWGYLDNAVELNRIRPYSVVFEPELTTEQKSIDALIYDRASSYDKRSKQMMGIILKERDLAMTALLDFISDEAGNHALVIPRGSAHVGLFHYVKLLHGKKYDVELYYKKSEHLSILFNMYVADYIAKTDEDKFQTAYELDALLTTKRDNYFNLCYNLLSHILPKTPLKKLDEFIDSRILQKVLKTDKGFRQIYKKIQLLLEKRIFQFNLYKE